MFALHIIYSAWEMRSEESMRNHPVNEHHQYVRIDSPFKEPVVLLSPEYLKPLSPLAVDGNKSGGMAELRGTTLLNMDWSNNYRGIIIYNIHAYNDVTNDVAIK